MLAIEDSAFRVRSAGTLCTLAPSMISFEGRPWNAEVTTVTSTSIACNSRTMCWHAFPPPPPMGGNSWLSSKTFNRAPFYLVSGAFEEAKRSVIRQR